MAAQGPDDGPIMDMTPLIDVVFQLLVFFMVCTVISQQDNANLRLPGAVAANKPDPKEKKLFAVDIAPSVQAQAYAEMPEEFGWFCYGQFTPKSAAEMKTILEKEAHVLDPDRGKPGYDQAKNLSENMIYVRVDARAPSAYFAGLVEMMVEARMYKIKIAIMKEPDLN